MVEGVNISISLYLQDGVGAVYSTGRIEGVNISNSLCLQCKPPPPPSAVRCRPCRPNRTHRRSVRTLSAHKHNQSPLICLHVSILTGADPTNPLSAQQVPSCRAPQPRTTSKPPHSASTPTTSFAPFSPHPLATSSPLLFWWRSSPPCYSSQLSSNKWSLP